MKIEATNLVFQYPGHRRVLTNVSFSLALPSDARCGSVIALMGPSGCGKSTLLRLLAGLESPTGGTLTIEPLPEVVPYITQDAVLLSHYSRRQNALYRSSAGRFTSRFNEEVFRTLQHSLGLTNQFLDDKRPLRVMSGGERQRLAILRDLSVSPDLLLLDEPCNGLDQPVKVEFCQQLRKIVAARRMLVMYVTHHRDEVEMVADHIAFLEPTGTDGAQRLVIETTSRALVAPPSLMAASLMTHPACNVLDCAIQGDGNLTPSPWRRDAARPERTVQLAFGLHTARFDDCGGPVEVLAHTPVVSFVRLGPQAAPLTIKGIPPSNPLLRIDGPAWLFDSPTSHGRPGQVSPLPENPRTCLRFQPL